MSTPAIEDFLTKQVLIAHNIVTYRSLSRDFGLAVNVAKNELSSFYSKAKTRQDTLAATFLISGTLTRQDDEMQNVDEDGYDDPEADSYVEDVVLLAPEAQLQDTKSQFSQISCIHIYSLSPGAVIDCAALCESDSIRRIDREKGDGFAQVVGKVVSENIKVIPEKLKKKAAPPPAPIAGPSVVKAESAKEKKAPEKKNAGLKAGKLDFSKAKPAKETENKESKSKATNKAPSGFFKIEKKASKPPPLEEEGEDEKPVPKPKAKEQKSSVKKEKVTALMSESEAEEKPVTSKTEKGHPVASSSKSIREKVDTHQKASQKRKSEGSDEEEDSSPKPTPKIVKKIELKRPTKRKTPVSESEEEEEEAPRPKDAKKQRVAISDEEDEAPIKRSRLRRRISADDDVDLKAMMDVDDEEVEVVRRSNKPSKVVDSDVDEDASMKDVEDEDEETSPVRDEDEDEDEDDKPAPKKRKPRKTKASIPVGKNGLKKKRVIKSRETTDKKGYVVTEDYSSYESVSEEEEEKPAPKPKAKPKAKAKVEEDSESEAESEPTPKPKPKPQAKAAADPDGKAKPKAKKGTKQPGISAFFGKRVPAK